MKQISSFAEHQAESRKAEEDAGLRGSKIIGPIAKPNSNPKISAYQDI